MFRHATGSGSQTSGSGRARRRGRLLTSFTLALFVAQMGMVPVAADPASPVSVVKTASSNPVASGQELTYTIVVTNLGASKVDNVVMTDQVNGVGVVSSPPGLPQLTITSTKGTCTQGGPNGNLVTCNAGSLSGREVWTVTIRGQVTAADGTTLNNTASVTGTKSAQTFTTTGSVSVDVRGGTGGGDLPDLTINKTGPTSVAPGSAFAYTLTVNNLGTVNTADVKVVDTLPAGVTFVSTATTSLFVCSLGGDGRTVTCTGGAINQGQNATITINATAPAANGTITNTAVVDPDNTIAESNELNNTSATVNTAVEGPAPAPLLTIVKTDGNPDLGVPWDDGAGPDPVNPGEWLTYVIQVVNTATSRADDVRISDTTQGLEASTLIVSQTVVGGRVGVGRGCVVNAAEAICSIQSLNAGGTLTMTVKGRVIAPAGSTMFNTATVHGNIKNVGLTNTSSEETTVRPIVDLTITKADSPDPACARTWPTSDPNRHLAAFPDGLAAPTGSIPDDPGFAPAEDGLLAPPVCLGGLTYTFVVGNSGNGDANDVVVRDPLPAGVLFDSYSSDAGFTCGLESPGGNIVRCTGGSILAASTRTLQLRVVAPPSLGAISNTVYVDPNNAIFEPDETNNTASATTTIATGVDLVIWKGDPVNPDPPGEDVDGPPTLVPGTATDLGDGYDPIATRGTQTYTIYVDNVGPQDVTGIRVRDTLPADTIFLSATSDPDHGFTCSHNGQMFGGTVECVGGHLLGTASEFYDPVGDQTVGPDPSAPGQDFATIKIRVFARSTVGTMHNEVRVDPLNEIAEVNELNNLDVESTTVGVGNADKGAYHQLTVEKTQLDPAGDAAVATNGVLIYDLKVSNLGTDPVSAIVVKDTLPTGTRFVSAKDTDVGTGLSDAFFCSQDGSATGGVVTCVSGDLSGSINVIPDGVSGDVPTFRTIRIKVLAPNVPGTIVNLATVDPDNAVAEGNEFDNDAFEDTLVAPCTSLADCTDKNSVYELTIEKTQNRSPIARNGLETYTLTVSNLGSDPISGITVQDFLPAGARFFDAKDTAVPPSDPAAFTCSHDGAPTGGTVTCVGGVLSGSDPALALSGVPTARSIQIRAFMPDTPGTYTNRAVVDPTNAIPEGNEFNNESSIETIVQNGGPNPYIDLQVDKTQALVLDQELLPDGNVRVDTGQGILYQLQVTNAGEGDAFNVTVRDVVPAGTSFFSAADAAPGTGAFTCTFAFPNVDCTGGAIPAGGSRTINVVLIAPTGLDAIASDPGAIKQTIINQAFADPFNAIGEGDETNNGDLARTVVESQVNLTIDKQGPTSASQNTTTEYSITVTNNVTWGDGRTIFGVEVVDPLPVGLIPIGSIEAGGNFTCQVEENPVNAVTCTGDLAPAQEVTITIPVFITADGGTLDNEACVDPDHVIDETSELDNCETAITGVTPSIADLAANKTADKGTVTAGETLTYTVTVINQGTADIVGTVAVDDPLPSEVTFGNVNPDAGWTCTGGATVHCERNGLAAGATSNIRIEVTVNSGATGPFTNDATVTGNGEEEHGTVTTNAGGAAVDLIVSGLSDNPDPANVGQNVTYTFAVSNGGSSPSGAFDITAQMDSGALSGLAFVGAAASQGFICSDIVTDTVTCTGSLLAGQSTNVTIAFQVLASSPTSHTLAVRVDPANAVAEASDANNDDDEITTVTASLCTGCVDLVAGGILDTPDPVAPGGAITRIATVSNAGDLSTAGLGPGSAVVWVIIDSAYETLGAYSATGGFTCTDFLLFGFIVVECTGDLGAGEGVAVTVNSTASGASDGDVLFATVFADPGDLFPEGTGFDHEFTNLNNDVTETTSVVAP